MIDFSIYDYQCPNLFLKDVWQKKRVFNRNFTLRAWAKQLGISSHGTLYQIVNDQRNLPKKYVYKIAESLKMNSKEALFFEILIDYKNSKSEEQKNFYSRRMHEVTPQSQLNTKKIDMIKYLEDPLNFAILELTSLADFRPSADWIQKRLTIETTTEKINSVIELLVNLNLLSYNQNDHLCRTHRHVTTTNDITIKGSQKHKKNVLRIASEQLPLQSIEKREYNATAFGVKTKDLPKIKDEIRSFINHLINKFEAREGEAEEIYQLGLQFFALTDKKE